MSLKLLYRALVTPFGPGVPSRKEADLFYLHGYQLDELAEIDGSAKNAQRAWVSVVARCCTGEQFSRLDPVSA